MFFTQGRVLRDKACLFFARGGLFSYKRRFFIAVSTSIATAKVQKNEVQNKFFQNLFLIYLKC